MNTLNNFPRSLLHYGQRLQAYFIMPSTNQPSLPETWLASIGLRSWVLTSLIVGIAPYLALALFSLFNDAQNWLITDRWRYGIIYPVATVYLLLLIPYFRNQLAQTAQAYIPLIPNIIDIEQFMAEAYQFSRKQEWLVLGLGTLAGLAIAPFEDLNGLWQTCYILIGQVMTLGLAGWVTYSVIVGTRALTSLYNQTQGMNIPLRGALPPLGRWTLGILLALTVAGLFTSLIFCKQ